VRVTFLVANYWPSVGGAQVHVQRVAEGLVARHGHHVEVVTTDAERAPGSRDPGRLPVGTDVHGGVTIRRLPVARRAHHVVRRARLARRRLGLGRGGPTLAAGPLGARLAVEAGRAARRSDVVVGVTAPSLTVAAADLATRGTGTAHVVMPLLHLGAGDPPPWAVRSMRRADGCTSSTPFERDWLVAHGLDPSRLAVLPPGCDPDRYPELDAPTARGVLGLPERPTVGFIGRMAAHKGIDTLAAAMPAVWERHPDTTLLLAGNRTAWAGLDDVLSRLRDVGGDRVVVHGPFADDERPTLLAACDVVAFPSREESFGMVTIEAWCARRPVVAADIDAVRCLVRPGVDGELVPVGDPAALTDAVAALLDDPDRAGRYALAGRSRAEAEFTWDGIVDAWDDFLAGAAARRRCGSGGGR
jgi:glycosyltransferase involved in cell wall biosynthesis